MDGNRIDSYFSTLVILQIRVYVCACVRVWDNAETFEHARIWTSSVVNMFRYDTLLLFLTAPSHCTVYTVGVNVIFKAIFQFISMRQTAR